MKNLTLQKGKKVYFASDNHLGAPTNKDSLLREKKFVAWLDSMFGLAMEIAIYSVREIEAKLVTTIHSPWVKTPPNDSGSKFSMA